jgi:hypothetical protein
MAVGLVEHPKDFRLRSVRLNANGIAYLPITGYPILEYAE